MTTSSQSASTTRRIGTSGAMTEITNSNVLHPLSPTILVLGATGLLGNAVFRRFSATTCAAAYGTIRSEAARRLFAPADADRLLVVENLENVDELVQVLDRLRPHVLINCIAVARSTPPDPMRSLMVHSVLPRRLSVLCRLAGSRLIQISSDGVFSGARGFYSEDDPPDANDVYGVSKLLGEVSEMHAITLRTSVIGHELQSRSGLLEWFLAQQGECRGHRRAIFSGFPSVVLADIIKDVVVPREGLRGIYHVASRPISKFDLLHLVAQRYGKTIRLIADDAVATDRSLNADRFAKATGYLPPPWPVLVDLMYRDRFALEESDVQR
jgi:dTDP-4-dehydrorhamnose reductase